MTKLSVPIHLRSESNIHDHWTKKNKRKNAVKIALRSGLTGMERPRLPCKIILTRIAPRQLDIDNLWSSMKTPIDIFCDWIIPGLPPGRADNDSRIEIECKQRKGKPREYAIEAEFIC